MGVATEKGFIVFETVSRIDPFHIPMTKFEIEASYDVKI